MTTDSEVNIDTTETTNAKARGTKDIYDASGKIIFITKVLGHV